jgi:lysozyme
MMANDLASAQRDLMAVFGHKYGTFTEDREAALMDMMFNMGLPVFLTFKKMIEAIKADDWEEAARQALDSRWAAQVGERAETDAKLLRAESIAHGAES